MGESISYIGNKFGRLTVLSNDNTIGKYKRFICECDCGSVKSYDRYNVINGKSASCGCKTPETIEKIRIGATKHGRSRTKTYKAWMSMKGRCLNPTYRNFGDYGGRGIKVCDRWLEGFENFFEDMGEASVGESLDRIDVDGNYEPENCRWANDEEQQNNKRNNFTIDANGRTQTVMEWARETGIDPNVIRGRIEKYKWSNEDAVNTPKKEYKKRKVAQV